MALPRLNDNPQYDLVIPSTNNQVKYRPFLVKEQKLLMFAQESDDENAIAERINGILKQEFIRGIVTNDLEFRYGINEFKEIDEPWILKKTKDDVRYDDSYKINKDESTDNDSQREALMQASHDLYGKREHRSNLYMLSSDDEVNKVSKYWIDRYHELHSKLIIRVPFRDCNEIGLFTNIVVSHTDLPNDSGTTDYLRGHSDGTPVVSYYHGTPVANWVGGKVKGQVVATWEHDEWIYFEIETMSSFEADQ